VFLDELPEFQRATLESLRHADRDRPRLGGARQRHVTYPARFQLVPP